MTSMSMIIKFSGICKAFDDNCVGTKVTNTEAFCLELMHALVAYDMPADGQGFIPLPTVTQFVLSGDCERDGLTASDFTVREHRGEMMLFAWRRILRPTFVAAVVYTIDAYCADPQVDEAEKAQLAGATHVLVQVIGSRGPKPTLTSSRFARNLAGGNASYAADKKSVESLIAEAKEIVEYETKWAVVADPAVE